MRRIIGVALVVCPLVAHADADPKAERLWKAKCASCHAADGKGQTEQGKKMHVADMSAAAWQAKLDDAKLQAAIENGIDRTEGGVKQQMEAYKAKLRPDQISMLVAYVRGLGKK